MLSITSELPERSGAAGTATKRDGEAVGGEMLSSEVEKCPLPSVPTAISAQQP